MLHIIYVIGLLRHITRHPAPLTPSVTSISAISSSCNVSLTGSRHQIRRVDRKRQTRHTLVLVVVTFAALWLPVHIHLLVMYFGKLTDIRFLRSFIIRCVVPYSSLSN